MSNPSTWNIKNIYEELDILVGMLWVTKDSSARRELVQTILNLTYELQRRFQ